MPPLISIIMPVYNAEQYVQEAIDSVLIQTHNHWELLVINDGSTDTSGELIQAYQDNRICYFEQSNLGVSAARNVGLKHMKGAYFCFLDADDQLTPNSLEARLTVFEQFPEASFVDGWVAVQDQAMTQTLRIWKPSLQGEVLEDLIKLTGNSFFGITWMVKRQKKSYEFNTSLTHGEDLYFYMQQAHKTTYAYASTVTYRRRTGNQSAMTDLTKLEAGYFSIRELLKQDYAIPGKLIQAYNWKIKSIMIKSWLAKGQLIRAVKTLVR